VVYIYAIVIVKYFAKHLPDSQKFPECRDDGQIHFGCPFSIPHRPPFKHGSPQSAENDLYILFHAAMVLFVKLPRQNSGKTTQSTRFCYKQFSQFILVQNNIVKYNSKKRIMKFDTRQCDVRCLWKKCHENKTLKRNRKRNMTS
jgi:hypothetical protein